MSTVRIWAVESDYNAKAVAALANSLVANLKLGDMSIQTANSKAFLMSNENGESLNVELKKAVRYYLKQDNCVIFFINSRGTTDTRPRLQKAKSLVKEIKQIVADPGFAGKVFFATGVPELEARLWRAHLGIKDPDRAARMDYAEARFRELCEARSLDWDEMTEIDRENFVDDLIHEDRECLQ